MTTFRAVMHGFALLLLSCLSCIPTGCQYDPWASGFLTAKPNEREIVGNYLIDADSQNRRIKLPMSNQLLPIIPSAQIMLTSDHKAEFVDVPEEEHGQYPCSVTGHGSWNVEKHDNFYEVRANITNETASGRCKGQFGYELMLYGRKPPYKLHITIGDPDSGDAVQFAKQR